MKFPGEQVEIEEFEEISPQFIEKSERSNFRSCPSAENERGYYSAALSSCRTQVSFLHDRPNKKGHSFYPAPSLLSFLCAFEP
jgi:hypothetical protein